MNKKLTEKAGHTSDINKKTNKEKEWVENCDFDVKTNKSKEMDHNNLDKFYVLRL